MKVINLKNYGVIVINTELTVEAMKKLAKHNPSALKLRDEEGNEIFGLGFGTASISQYGINFDRMDSDGKALITINATMENTEIAEEYAAILMKAKTVETNALATYAELNNMLMEVANSIEEGGVANA